MNFWEECKARLESKGLTPMCDQRQWEFFHEEEMAMFHQLCAEREPFAPIQTIQCKNCATGEVRPFPYNQIVQKCHELMRQDPNWTLEVCYGCCPG